MFAWQELYRPNGRGLGAPEPVAEDTAEVPAVEIDATELEEWFESLDDILHRYGPEKVSELLSLLDERAHRAGVKLPFTANTPYVNTIPLSEQPKYPGDRTMERRIKSIIRWNAMAMVVRANRTSNVGGHISTYASSATLVEAGFNHFFRGTHERPSGRPGLLPGARLAGNLRPGLRRRAADGREPGQFPP